MSARRGHAWRGGEGSLFTRTAANRTARPTAVSCPAGHVRVAILKPDGTVSQVKTVELIDGKAVVPLLGKRIQAEPMQPHPDAPGARYKVTMPTREEEP